MQNQPTVLLQHTTRTGCHYDWLVGDPTVSDPAGRLWTARVGLHSRAWEAAGRLELTVLSPHRRVYLTYEGPISGGRGVVRRVDAGTVHPLCWTADRRVLAVRMEYYVGLVEMHPLAGDRWLGRIEATCAGGAVGKNFAD